MPEPTTLISSVPHGKRGPVSAVIAAASQKRARLPIAPPAATASQVVAVPMRASVLVHCLFILVMPYSGNQTLPGSRSP